MSKDAYGGAKMKTIEETIKKLIAEKEWIHSNLTDFQAVEARLKGLSFVNTRKESPVPKKTQEKMDNAIQIVSLILLELQKEYHKHGEKITKELKRVGK